MADQVIQNIKDKLNIFDVIGGYLQLKKAGVNYRALCPFHSERTPSFNVSPQRQIWHCFGCGEGGDIFGFVMRYENVDFKEALKILAQKAGVQLPAYRLQDPKEQEEKKLLFRINDFAARLYHQVLFKDEKVMAYLKGRGLSVETIKQWQIGFAPEGFHFLHHALLKKNIKEEKAIRAGVLARGERGTVYDRFRGRITFPIFDYFGEIAGFSARILPNLDDGKSGKYINSPETEIFHKGKVLFGFNFAKEAIRKQNEVIIVEGQMDCISAQQAGFKNVVATSGTALTMDQLVLLGRFTKNLKYCFDADMAGLKATESGFDLLIYKDFVTRAVLIKEAKDVDELLQKNPQKFSDAVKEAPLFMDYYIDKLFEQFRGSPLEQKKLISKSILPYIKIFTDPLEQDHYIQLLSSKFTIDKNILREALNKVQPFAGLFKEKVSDEPQKVGAKSQNSALEKEILGGLLTYPEFALGVKGELEETDFENVEIGRMAMAQMLGLLEQSDKDSTLAKEAIFMVDSLGQEQDQKQVLKKLLKSFYLLKANRLKKKQKILQTEMARAENLKDSAKTSQLKSQFAQVSQAWADYEKKS